MKYALAMSTALLLAMIQVQPAMAQKNGNNSLVSQAIAAEGGADALRALKGVGIKADVKLWGPEQSESPGGAPRDYGIANLTITWDLARGMARTEWDRDQKYPSADKLKYTETVLPTMGMLTNTAGYPANQLGNFPMSGTRVATHLRELMRASPTLLLAALDQPASVGPMGPQKMGNQSLPAIALTAGGTKFTILFDSKTKLPAVIRTRDDDNVFGDANYDLELGDWKAVGGVKIAHSLSYKINGIEVQKVTYTNVTANPSIAADAFNLPDAVKTAAKAPATGNVPYQWILRRQFLARYADTDGIIYPPNGSLKLVELAPNVQHVQGAGANNLIVAMKDHLVIVDAPYGDLQSLQVIALAKSKYPGKPIKTLILSHHHNDHSGGTRAFVAEGAQVIVAAPGKAHFDKTLKMAHTVVPDEMQKKGRVSVKVVEVKDTMTLKDDSTEVRLYNIPNPHVNGYLLVHVAKENVVYTTDLLSPRGQVDRTPGTVAVGDALKKYGITGSTIAGGHGTVVKQAEIGPALGMVGAAR
jgi:glyoxylase-like metal-dependent hydrolase (beta-lactamase superfamily II)